MNLCKNLDPFLQSKINKKIDKEKERQEQINQLTLCIEDLNKLQLQYVDEAVKYYQFKLSKLVDKYWDTDKELPLVTTKTVPYFLFFTKKVKSKSLTKLPKPSFEVYWGTWESTLCTKCDCNELRRVFELLNPTINSSNGNLEEFTTEHQPEFMEKFKTLKQEMEQIQFPYNIEIKTITAFIKELRDRP